MPASADRRLLVSVVVFPAAVVVSSQPRLQLGDCGVERGVKIGPAGFGVYGAALAVAEDCNPLACLGLAGIVFVVQFDVVTDHVAVVPLQADQLLCDVQSEVIGHVDVATRHDNFHRGVHLVLTELQDVLEFTVF